LINWGGSISSSQRVSYTPESRFSFLLAVYVFSSCGKASERSEAPEHGHAAQESVLTSILVRLAFGSGDTPASAEQRPCQHEREDNGPRPIVARAVLVSS
jgi:hypothetical protein